jgi:hypothetical protein
MDTHDVRVRLERVGNLMKWQATATLEVEGEPAAKLNTGWGETQLDAMIDLAHSLGYAWCQEREKK